MTGKLTVIVEPFSLLHVNIHHVCWFIEPARDVNPHVRYAVFYKTFQNNIKIFFYICAVKRFIIRMILALITVDFSRF